MNTKKFFTGLMIALVLVTGVFANGRGEQRGGPRDVESCEEQQQYHAEMKAEIIEKINSLEKVNLTGEITVRNRFLPELTDGGDVYTLLTMPGFFYKELEVKDGDTITVEGAVVTEETFADLTAEHEDEEYNHRGMMGFGFMHNSASDDDFDGTLFLVTKMTINGEEHDLIKLLEELEAGGPGRGRGGNQRGMMGGKKGMHRW